MLPTRAGSTSLNLRDAYINNGDSATALAGAHLFVRARSRALALTRPPHAQNTDQNHHRCRYNYHRGGGVFPGRQHLAVEAVETVGNCVSHRATELRRMGPLSFFCGGNGFVSRHNPASYASFKNRNTAFSFHSALSLLPRFAAFISPPPPLLPLLLPSRPTNLCALGWFDVQHSGHCCGDGHSAHAGSKSTTLMLSTSEMRESEGSINTRTQFI